MAGAVEGADAAPLRAVHECGFLAAAKLRGSADIRAGTNRLPYRLATFSRFSDTNANSGRDLTTDEKCGRRRQVARASEGDSEHE
jgi:hypothetical protein